MAKQKDQEFLKEFKGDFEDVFEDITISKVKKSDFVKKFGKKNGKFNTRKFSPFRKMIMFLTRIAKIKDGKLVPRTVKIGTKGFKNVLNILNELISEGFFEERDILDTFQSIINDRRGIRERRKELREQAREKAVKRGEVAVKAEEKSKSEMDTERKGKAIKESQKKEKERESRRQMRAQALESELAIKQQSEENQKTAIKIQETNEELQELKDQEVIDDTLASEEPAVKTIKIKIRNAKKEQVNIEEKQQGIVKVVKKADKKAVKEQENRDKPQDVSNVENAGLDRAHNELSMAEQDVNNASQEQQLEAQASPAEVPVEIGAIQQSGDNQGVQASQNQNDVVEVLPVEQALIANQVEAKEERKDGNPEFEPVAPVDDRVRIGRKIENLKSINAKLKKLNKRATTKQEQDVLEGELVRLTDIPGVLDDEDQPEIRRLLPLITVKMASIRGLRVEGARIQSKLDIAREEGKTLQRQLTASEIAIKTIKSRVLADGLTNQGFQLETIEGKQIVDAVIQLDAALESKGEVTDSIFSQLEGVFRIVSMDTFEVLESVLRNDPFSIINPTTVAVPLLQRLIGRMIYSGSGISGVEAEANINAFLTQGLRIQGQNSAMVVRLLNALIPPPPSSSLPVNTLARTRATLARTPPDLGIGFESNLQEEKKSLEELFNEFSDSMSDALNISIESERIRRFMRSPIITRTFNPSNQQIERFINSLTLPQVREIIKLIIFFEDNPNFSNSISPDLLFFTTRGRNLVLTENFKRKVQENKRLQRISERTGVPVSSGDTDFVLKDDLETGVTKESAPEPEQEVNEEELRQSEEQLFELFGGVGRASASFAAISATTPREEVGLFTKGFESAVRGAQNLPNIRDAVLNAPRGALRDVAERMAVNYRPILQRGRGRAVPTTLLTGAVVAGILSVFASVLGYGRSSSERVEQEQEQEQEQPQQQQRTGQGGRPEDRTIGRGTASEFFKGREMTTDPDDIDKPVGEPLLRPEFKMVGTNYLDRDFARVPLNNENSEWAEFNYVDTIDRQNRIEIDNGIGKQIRYSEPMFLPKYTRPVRPPSRRAQILGRTDMIDQIQIQQRFAPKFDGAINIYDNMSNVYNRDPFARGFNDIQLFNPDASTHL